MANPPFARLSPFVGALHAFIFVAKSVVNSYDFSSLREVDAVSQSKVGQAALLGHDDDFDNNIKIKKVS